MLQRLMDVFRAMSDRLAKGAAPLAGAAGGAARAGADRALSALGRAKGALLVLLVLVGAGYVLYANPPIATVGRGEVGVRVNRLTGGVSEWRDGSVFVMPGIHDMKVYSVRDRTYQPEAIRRADGPAPLQSVEGLSLGVDLAVRYALDASRLATTFSSLPDDIGADLVAPAVQGVIYKTFSRYTVREIFSTKRVEIQQAIEAELASKLTRDGVVLRSVQMGKVDLPADYKRGMDTLLAEELAAQKMRYTLELKDKRVQETALEGEAAKVRSEKAAEAAARAQVIAAKGQEEAMKHVLPFKQRQIEQRQLEAEAEKAARIRAAEGAAQARRIEATGEADARQKLADAEAYRLDRLGKVNAEQMAREGTLITRHPLLIQKALADKLADKVQVIIAPPPADGGFIAAPLLGASKRAMDVSAAAEARETRASRSQ
ncbi:MAG TPA: SPFH domain-containing protein [Burkholderiales bacterium]|nr:SPFH domain-containing protein [Burkholderiales bacterium]